MPFRCVLPRTVHTLLTPVFGIGVRHDAATAGYRLDGMPRRQCQARPLWGAIDLKPCSTYGHDHEIDRGPTTTLMQMLRSSTRSAADRSRPCRSDETRVTRRAVTPLFKRRMTPLSGFAPPELMPQWCDDLPSGSTHRHRYSGAQERPCPSCETDRILGIGKGCPFVMCRYMIKMQPPKDMRH